ncbi:MAG: DMT family transporter [Clostridiales bacterium]|nr:DMT family transporter [Clostridiales bacterium]
MWGIWVALASGAMMSLQGVWNTAVTRQTSIWVCSGWVQLTAFIACAILWFFSGRESIPALFSVRPLYLLAGGILGTFITYTVIKSMDGLGPARATLLIVVTQIITAWCIEFFGLFGVEKVPFEWRKIIGACIAIAGIAVFQW